MGNINSFEDLECWKASRALRIFVSKNVLPKFPEIEKYALTSQLRRSSRSVGDNIAEGFGRYNYQENIQACRVARGSLCEALNQMITAVDEDYIDIETLEEFRSKFNETKAILNGYINYLKNAKNS